MKIWGISGPYHVRSPKTIVDKEGQDLIGCHRWVEREIVIRADLKGHARTNIIWHEWCHAVMADGGVSLSKNAAERVCNILAAALTGAGVKPPLVK